MNGNEIRKRFLDYFEERGHTKIKSSSLVPQDDPTLLFTNAGMVPFKRLFLNQEKRSYTRGVSCQKCVRAGGKHNDLENVGYTARHHTFFEMLGNFSFGDYFKKKAISLAWEFITKEMGISEEKLWITIHHDDDEALDIWTDDIGISRERIVKMGDKDNFWSMGDTGPCGPCSEIHFDQGAKTGCRTKDCRLGCECDRFLELWNLVFMQYNRDENGRLTPLPKPSIDTGMGVERIAAVLQGVQSNYDTDIFKPIISAISDFSGVPYGQDEKTDVSIKVISDHARASAFLIADGIMPSNEGRGYVLRRIIRRALRHGRFLNIKGVFLSRIVNSVIDSTGDIYPELPNARSYIQNVILNEETRFSETLDNGLNLLNEEVEKLKKLNLKEFPGSVMFKLYDTFGFPTDIVTDTVRAIGLSIDNKGFDQAMKEQRQRSRRAWKGSGESEISGTYQYLSAKGVKTIFLGYEQQKVDTKIIAIIDGEKIIDTAHNGMDVDIVVKETPFFGASGGQMGDQGVITGQNGLLVKVRDVFNVPDDLIIHKCHIEKGIINKGDMITMAYDTMTRGRVAANHTATHLLHAALRTIIGEHAKQQGSMVSSERLRFDFTHFSRLSREELVEIEDLVNQKICENIPINTEIMDMEQAVKTGATALFEEKYGDKVRVVDIKEFSKELCGGTHVTRTGDIGFFKLVSEGSVASGIRRIEALTGGDALNYIRKMEDREIAMADLLKISPDNFENRLKNILERQKKLEKEIMALKTALSSGNSGNILDNMEIIDNVNVLIQKVEGVANAGDLRDMVDKIKDKIKSGIIILAAMADEKAILIAGVTKDMTKRFHAGTIIKSVAKDVGGSGGGRPDMAQAGGTKPGNIDMALKKAKEDIKAMITA